MNKKVIEVENDHIYQWDNYFRTSMDPNSRCIWVTEIDDDAHTDILKAVKFLESVSMEPITVYVDSYGGSMYEALAIYDVLTTSPCTIKTIGVGKVMSAGVIVLLSGSIVEAYRNTTFMLHEVAAQSGGKTSEIENELKETKRLQEILLDILNSVNQKGKDWWNRKIKSIDVYFTTEEALSIGIIDGVI